MNTQLPIFYISNDPLRGLGIEDIYENFHLICVDYIPVVDWLMEQGRSVFCLEKELGQKFIRDSRETLFLPEVQDYILKHSKIEVGIVFFKPQVALSQILKNTTLGKSRQVKSLNAQLLISNQIENKIYFHNLCKNNQLSIAPAIVGNCSQLKYADL